MGKRSQQPSLPRINQNGSKKMKYYGKIGFAITEDDGDGVWTPSITAKNYSGDILRMIRNKEGGEHINDGLRINSQFSIVMDLFFQDHFSQIRYIEYMGAKWNVDSIELNYPRALITPGGIYHGNEPEEESEGSTSENTGGDSGE
jgi:hypothetical protein